MAEGSSIPVVDVQYFREAFRENHPVVQRLHDAFSTVGFVFLTNSGIETSLVDRAFKAGFEFFTLSVDTKMKFARKGGTDNNGYVCMENESVDPLKPGDLKECYNICSKATSHLPAESEAPSFRSSVVELFDACRDVTLKILEAMGHALRLKDPQFFVKAHQSMDRGADFSYTTMRLLYYPALPLDLEIKPGQLRCGEHIDYGSITLLFQDPNGGLQVKRRNDEYINVPYIPDAILVNLGALMQNWTADTYLATPHRVLIPTDEVIRQTVRQSIAFFVHPDNEVLVECIDGSNKYPPVTAKEDTRRRLDKSYDPSVRTA